MQRITTVVKQAPRFRTVVTARGRSLEVTPARAEISVMQVSTGLTGAPGSSGQAQISTDDGNQLSQGSDQKLFVAASFTVAARFAEIAEDPTAQDQARQNLGLLTIDGGTFN